MYKFHEDILCIFSSAAYAISTVANGILLKVCHMPSCLVWTSLVLYWPFSMAAGVSCSSSVCTVWWEFHLTGSPGVYQLWRRLRKDFSIQVIQQLLGVTITIHVVYGLSFLGLSPAALRFLSFSHPFWTVVSFLLCYLFLFKIHRYIDISTRVFWYRRMYFTFFFFLICLCFIHPPTFEPNNSRTHHAKSQSRTFLGEQLWSHYSLQKSFENIKAVYN